MCKECNSKFTEIQVDSMLRSVRCGALDYEFDDFCWNLYSWVTEFVYKKHPKVKARRYDILKILEDDAKRERPSFLTKFVRFLRLIVSKKFYMILLGKYEKRRSPNNIFESEKIKIYSILKEQYGIELKI